MATENRLSRIVHRLTLLPAAVRSRALSAVVGRVVPFVGTANVRLMHLAEDEVVVRLDNRRAVQNHIKTLHAAAVVLAAETASGMVVGMNIPDDKVPLMKSLRVDYLEKNRGGITVTARLDEAQRARIATEDKGEVDVEVHAVDDENKETVRCTMLWAWRKKR